MYDKPVLQCILYQRRYMNGTNSVLDYRPECQNRSGSFLLSNHLILSGRERLIKVGITLDLKYISVLVYSTDV